MARSFKVVFLAVIFSFLWGLWWSTKDKYPLTFRDGPEKLSVLAPSDVLSESFIQQMAAQGFEITLTTKADSYELLREILSPARVYDLVLFPSTLTDSLQFANFFSPTFSEKVYDKLGVSIDFRSLTFDSENRYLVPLLWTVYGWSLPKPDPDFSLQSAMENTASAVHFAVVPAAALMYGVMQKLFPPAHSFIQTSNEDEIAKVFRDFQKFVKLRSAKVSEKVPSLVQVKHTEETTNFAMPIEKADLVLVVAAVSAKTHKKEAALEALKVIFENSMVKELVTYSQMASVKDHEQTKGLFPDAFQSNHIRSLPISRLALLAHHESFEPMFTEFLRNHYSDALKGISSER